MPKYILNFAVCLVATTLSACGQVTQTKQIKDVVRETSKTSHSFNLAVFESNRTKWLSSNIKGYSINISASGFLRRFMPAVIEVRDSKLKSIIPQDPSRDQRLVGSYKDLKLTTVDEIFAFIESQAKQKPDLLDIVYDDKYGFPVSVILDQKKGWSDDELLVSVTNFEVK